MYVTCNKAYILSLLIMNVNVSYLIKKYFILFEILLKTSTKCRGINSRINAQHWYQNEIGIRLKNCSLAIIHEKALNKNVYFRKGNAWGV